MNTSIQQGSYSKIVTQLNPNQAFALNAILVGRVTSIGAHGSMSAIQIPTFNLVYHMRAEKNKHAEVWKKTHSTGNVHRIGNFYQQLFAPAFRRFPDTTSKPGNRCSTPTRRAGT